MYDLFLWDTGFFPRSFMAKVVAFSKLYKLMELHTEDAKAKAIEHNKRGA